MGVAGLSSCAPQSSPLRSFGEWACHRVPVSSLQNTHQICGRPPPPYALGEVAKRAPPKRHRGGEMEEVRNAGGRAIKSLIPRGLVQ